MKKIYTLLFVFISYVSVTLATPGDTTWVTAHINDTLDYYGTFTAKAQLPNTGATYRKIYLLFTIGRYECPPGSTYCGQWDYSLDFIAKPLNPSVSLEEYEIARGITPYAGSMTGIFSTAWDHTYYMDVTDFSPILRDSIELKALYSGYSGGFTLDTRFMFIEGIPAKEATAIHRVQRGYYAYGGATSIETHLIPDTTQIVAPATNADMLVSITGHGIDDLGCSEFCKRYYTLSLNGSQIAVDTLWNKCGFCDIQAQTGTWVFDRAGWCPGEKVPARRHHLNGISPGTNFVVDMDMEPYSGSTGGSPGYSVASYIISYKNPAHSVDADLEDILSPSTKDDYKKYNPSCVNPIIVLKNAGTTPLTSAVIRYGKLGSTLETYTWTGSIPFLQSATISLPAVPVGVFTEDSTTFIAYIEKANGSVDQYAANDTNRSLYRRPPSLPESFIIRLRTNNTAVTSNGVYNETSWKLYNGSGTIVRQRINNAHSTTYNDTLTLEGGCYSLVVTDEGWEDGLSWWFYPNYPSNPGSGALELRNATTGAMISNSITQLRAKLYGGDFGSKAIYNFTVNFPTNIPDIGLVPFELNTYPNPAKNILHVELLGVGSDTHVQLFDMNGKILYSNLVNKSTTLQIPTTGIASGIYFLKVVSGLQNEVRRIVVE